MKKTTAFALALVFSFVLCLKGTFQVSAADQPRIRLTAEVSLDSFGGVPFLCDLDGDGLTDHLWLQSAGMFRSEVYKQPRFAGLQAFSKEELAHYCLTATDRLGKILWQIGKPWKGERPFVTHQSERSLDVADIDGDGQVEVVATMSGKLAVIDGKTGHVEKEAPLQSDNVIIVRLAHTGPGDKDWTILAKVADAPYPPHETANPAHFYDNDLKLIKTADYLGAGHAPLVMDFDGDGLDEFLIGYNLVDHNLATVWIFKPAPEEEWNAPEMHADGVAVGRIGKDLCVAYAASDTTYLVTADKGELIWKKQSIHPQQSQIGRFLAGTEENQVFVHNKRANLELLDARGQELWSIEPPENFPFGKTEATQKKFHMFDPTVKIPGAGPQGTDALIFTDAGWPYIIDGMGRRLADFPHTKNIHQDWGDVPSHRPDDYGYGFYARLDPRSLNGKRRVIINDRRFAWVYELDPPGKQAVSPPQKRVPE